MNSAWRIACVCLAACGVDRFVSTDGGERDGAAADASSFGDGGEAGCPAGPGTIVADGGSPSGPGPGGSIASEPCGDAVCTLPGQLCCVYLNATAPDFSFACATSDCPAGCRPPPRSPRTLRCSDGVNCPPATVCCVAQAPTTMEVSSSCKPACGPNEGQLCDPQAPVSDCAADAGGCSSSNIGDWGLPKRYATCGGVCPGGC